MDNPPDTMRERDRHGPESPIRDHLAERTIDGERLYEVSRALCVQAGHQWPVRITPEVAALVVPPIEEGEREGAAGKGLQRMLWLASVAMADAPPDERLVPFEVTCPRGCVRLWGCFDIADGLAIHILRLKGD